MSDTMLPILRQMHDAESDAARARILLNVPDLLLAKYQAAFSAACRRVRFDLGEEYVLVRINTMRAVRDDMGNLPPGLTLQMRDMRVAMVGVLGGLEAAS